METQIQITFRNMETSPALEQLIREKAKKLETTYPRITGCRVIVQAPHRHHQNGNHFRVCVDLTIPGMEIVAARTPTLHAEHEDAYMAVREAFRHVRRELAERVDRRREGKDSPRYLYASR